MPSVSIRLAVKIAWWVRPALAITMFLDRVQPTRTEARIDWIVSRGIRQRTLVT